MNIYENHDIEKLLCGNPYVGRGIVAGKSEDGKKAFFVYFIMGRSENSRNRIFVKRGEDVEINAFDPSKLSDPSLIIYYPVRVLDRNVIVTNGDQTDTVYNFLKDGKSFEEALETREFEPDAPNFTPRISALLNFDKEFTYKMSILKSADSNGSACVRETFSYPSLCGTGHFLHTYICDGNPIPTFCGEPERISICGDINSFAQKTWNALDKDNKISLCARSIDIETLETETIIINKNTEVY